MSIVLAGQRVFGCHFLRDLRKTPTGLPLRLS